MSDRRRGSSLKTASRRPAAASPATNRTTSKEVKSRVGLTATAAAKIMSASKTPSSKTSKPASSKKLSRTRRPAELPPADWQLALRQQFGQEQQYRWQNTGKESVFSEFLVTNPESGMTYRVAIRGEQPGRNYCSCPDFRTNQLGTCKHAEFVLTQLRAKPATRRKLAAGFHPPFSEIYVEYGKQRQIRWSAGTDCPRALRQLADHWFDDMGCLREEHWDTLDRFLATEMPANHEVRCYPDALQLMAQRRDDVIRRELLARQFPHGTKSAAFADLVKADLFEFQREGALFAARAGRCLIGDEMGLGKTVQSLAATEILARHLGIERVLIVCPTSLKFQWEREILRFTDRSVHVVNGSLAERKAGFQTDSFFKVTNYDTLHRDQTVINAWAPDLIILDEAQRIKNWSTRAAKTVKRLESPYAFVLTGTPLENRLEELVSIVQFVDQHRLGPTWQLMQQHQHVDEVGRVVGYKDLHQIGQALKPILLRRKKAEVLSQLPNRSDRTLLVPMTPQQLEHHGENADLVARIVSKWRRTGFLSDRDQQALMIGLQRMRMSCNSTYLLDHQTDFSVKFDELAERLEGFLADPETKVVLFSQWLGTHELLQRRFATRNWEHVFFHGGVPSAKRKKLVDRFREDPACRLFLATDSGGVGLNLQHAHVVVNMDLPWNPAILEQRIGRVFRLGQTRPVQVLNLVSQGTIEEGMQGVLQFKKDLFAGVLDGGLKDVFLEGTRLSQFMKSVEAVTNGVPAAKPLEAEDADAAADVPVNSVTAEDAVPVNRLPGSAVDNHASPSQVLSAQVMTDPFSDLLRLGLSFLESMTSPTNHAATDASQPAAQSPLRLETDAQTGKPYLRIDGIEPERFHQLLDGVEKIVQVLRPRK